MCLYALNIVYDLTLHASLSDSHSEEIFQECFKLRVLCQRAVRTISILISDLATLCNQDTAVEACFLLIIFVRADFDRIFQDIVLHRNYFLIESFYLLIFSNHLGNQLSILLFQTFYFICFRVHFLFFFSNFII